MPREKKKFALVWWVESEKSDVIPLASIPKTQRNVDALATLTWEDFQTKKKSKEQAKIIAISSDENALHKKIVTTNGTLHDMKLKIFTEDVLTHQKHMTQSKNVIKSIQRSSKKKVEQEIRNDPPISYQSVGKRSTSTRSSVPKTSTQTCNTGTLDWPNEKNQDKRATPTATNVQPDRSRHSQTQALLHQEHNISPGTVDYAASSWPQSQYTTATTTELQQNRPQHTEIQALSQNDHPTPLRTVDYTTSTWPRTQYTPATTTDLQRDRPQHTETQALSQNDHPTPLRTVDYTSTWPRTQYTPATTTDLQRDRPQHTETQALSQNDHPTPLRTVDYTTSTWPRTQYTPATTTDLQRDRPQHTETQALSQNDHPTPLRTVDYTSTWPRTQYTPATTTDLQRDRPQHAETRALSHNDHPTPLRTVDYTTSTWPRTQYTPATTTDLQRDRPQHIETQGLLHHDHQISPRTVDYSISSQPESQYTTATLTATPIATNPQSNQLQHSQTLLPSHHDHRTLPRPLDYPISSQPHNQYTTATPTPRVTVTHEQLDRPQYSETSSSTHLDHRSSNVLPLQHYPNPRSVSPDLNVTSDSANSSPSRTHNTVLPGSPLPLIESQPNLISGSQSDEEAVSSDTESYGGGSGLFSRIACGEVTKRDIVFQTQLLKAMTKAYNDQKKTNINSLETPAIEPHYLEDGVEKMEISPNCGFYLPKAKVTYLELKTKMDDDWRILVRETLLEVYGASISNFSATGKRGSRPGVDCRLFQGLYEWVNRSSKELVDKKAFIEFINKLASNKRKYRKPSKLQPPNKKVKSRSQTIKLNKKAASGASFSGSIPVSRDAI